MPLPTLEKRSEWLRRWNAREVFVIMGGPCYLVWYDASRASGHCSRARPQRILIEPTCELRRPTWHRLEVRSAGRSVMFQAPQKQESEAATAQNQQLLSDLADAVEEAARPRSSATRIALSRVVSVATGAAAAVATAASLVLGGTSVGPLQAAEAALHEAATARAAAVSAKEAQEARHGEVAEQLRRAEVAEAGVVAELAQAERARAKQAAGC